MKLFQSVVGPSGAAEGPLLILHGLFGSHRNWATIAKSLSEQLGRLVIAADLRNHGQSVQMCDGRPEGAPMTWPLMAADIRGLVEEIQRPVTIIGHSLGGQVAMQALSSGVPAERFISVDIAPVPYPFVGSAQAKYIDAMLEIDGAALPHRDAIERFRQSLPGTDELIVQFLFTNYADGKGHQPGFLIPLETLKSGMTTLGTTFSQCLSNRITAPTVFIRGGRSDYITDQNIPAIEATFPDHSIAAMPDSGHWPHYDNPTKFIRIIKEHTV